MNHTPFLCPNRERESWLALYDIQSAEIGGIINNNYNNNHPLNNDNKGSRYSAENWSKYLLATRGQINWALEGNGKN